MAGGDLASRSLSGVWVSGMNAKSYVFVMRRLPHFSSHVQETLDQILTTAAFDQAVTLVFVDDGVLQLKQGQNASGQRLKNTAAMMSALALYGVEQVYVEQESLAARGLVAEDLCLPVRILPRSQVNDLIRQHDVVMPD